MDNLFASPGIFTPDGRLQQVEYALEAVGNSNDLIAIQTTKGLLIGTELKNQTEVEDDKKYPRNIFLIDKHILIGVSGNIPDSQIIVTHSRAQAQQYKFIYQEDIPIDEIVSEISNIKQQFTQSRISRPIGCSIIIAGWDRFSGFRLIKMDVSGTFSGWKAVSIGKNSVMNQVILDTEFKLNLGVSESLALLMQILKKKSTYVLPSKTFDIYTFIIDHEKNILIHRLSKKEQNSLIN